VDFVAMKRAAGRSGKWGKPDLSVCIAANREACDKNSLGRLTDDRKLIFFYAGY
jgi:hypothetical protein